MSFWTYDNLTGKVQNYYEDVAGIATSRFGTPTTFAEALTRA